jgi:hypothetical protein
LGVRVSNKTGALIRRYIAENPSRPGPADARFAESGTAVWAFIEYLNRAVAGDLEQAARDYEVPREAAEAALAFYRQHRPLIDARIAVNAA